MSTREPNRIIPTRSPRAQWSPGFFRKTIRRASAPAICLKTTRRQSPARSIMFCSLSSDAFGEKAASFCPGVYV